MGGFQLPEAGGIQFLGEQACDSMDSHRKGRPMRPKRPSRNAEQAAPDNWMDLLSPRGLDLALDGLEAFNNFHTDTLRGRTRSLQLQSTEAWKYFREAESRIGEFKPSDQNLMRHFFLKVYSFENATTDESLPDGGNPGRTARF